MYIWKKAEGLGQNQESWSAPQALTRVKVQSVPMGYLGRFDAQLGNDAESCEARYNVEYFDPGSDKINRIIKTDLQDIAKHMFKLLQSKLAGLRGKKIDIKKDVILHIYVKGYVDIHEGSDPADHDNLDYRRAFAVLEPLHLYAVQKNIPRKNIEYDYSGGGQYLPRSDRKPGKNRLAKVCVRWEIKP